MKAGKGLYIGMLGTSLLFGGLLVFSLWSLLANQAGFLVRTLLFLMAVILAALLLLAGIGIGLIGLTLNRGRLVARQTELMFLTLNLFFPLAVRLGPLLGISRPAVEHSFIELNNCLVRMMAPRVAPERLLLLAPHCLQNKECPRKITLDVNNCQRCGRCPIRDLLELGESYGIRVAVATGGTLARQFVAAYRPEGVVAIACERDLSSGIQDSSPLPVLGVLNERPEGPCLNTRVSLEKVREAVEYFTKGGDK